MSLHTKLAEVMGEVGFVPKRGRNDFHKYDYVLEADLVDAVRDKLAKRSVMLYTSVDTVTRDAQLTTVLVTFTLADGESGETFTFGGAGTGEDKSDKGVYKALTGALKYGLMKLFLGPTGDDPEASNGQETKRRSPSPAEERRSRAPSEEDGGKPTREAPSEREGKGGARTSGERVDDASRTGKARNGDSEGSPDTPGGAEVAASTPSGSTSGGADTTPPAPPAPPDEATQTFLEALDTALKNAFGNKATASAAFMRDFLKRAGVDAASKLSEQSRVLMLEQLAEKAGAKA